MDEIDVIEASHIADLQDKLDSFSRRNRGYKIVSAMTMVTVTPSTKPHLEYEKIYLTTIVYRREA